MRDEDQSTTSSTGSEGTGGVGTARAEVVANPAAAGNGQAPIDWHDYVVHLPLPQDFGTERAAARAALLCQVRYLLVVGSLRRPRRVAELAASELGLRHVGTYFDIVDDPDVCDREYNIEVVDLGLESELGRPVHAAVVSHGIGASGVEIVLTELPALIQLCRAQCGLGGAWRIDGVGRSGTRATLSRHEYGTVGISTASFDDALEVALPDPVLLDCAVQAARSQGVPYALGSGVSTSYFWSGQGRIVPTQRALSDNLRLRRERAGQELMWRWVERGIDFVEMEDHAVHRFSRLLGMPSVSAGAVIARRFDAERGAFVLDYDADAKHRSELLPAAVMLEAFRRHARLAERP